MDIKKAIEFYKKKAKDADEYSVIQAYFVGIADGLVIAERGGFGGKTFSLEFINYPKIFDDLEKFLEK